MSYKEKPQLHLYEYKNNSFIQTAIIDDYKEVSFEHNLYSAGTFTITINYNVPNALLFERGMFIQFGSAPYDFGEILSIRDTIGEDGKGSQIRTITGYDARYIFKRRVIKNLNSNGMWKMTAKGEACMRELISSQCGANAEEKRRLPITNEYNKALANKFVSASNNLPLVDFGILGGCQEEKGLPVFLAMLSGLYYSTDSGYTVFNRVNFTIRAEKVIWSNRIRKYICIGGDSNGNRLIIYSNNGSTWQTAFHEQVDDRFLSICETPDKLVVCTISGGIFESVDGVSWSETSSIHFGYCSDICYSEDLRLFVVVCDNASVIGYSSDLTTWTNVSSHVNYLNYVIWNSDLRKFVACGREGFIVISSDGAHWEAMRVNIGEALWLKYDKESRYTWVCGTDGIARSLDLEHWEKASGNGRGSFLAYDSEGKIVSIYPRATYTQTEENAVIGKTYAVSEAYTNLYEVCKTIATQSEIGWRVKFDNGSLKLECYEGTDRSDTVQFSTDFDSLRDGEFSDSSESYSNAIYIGGKGQNDERDIYEGEDGTPNGLDRFEAWDDQSQMTTTDEYSAEALSMLSQYGQTVNVSGNGLAKCPYIYKEQYDVGDIITIAFSGKTAKVQILSVTERWAWNQYDINFSFGKPQNNLAEQLQLMLRKIQGASNKEKATESVKWYTIPTATAMPKDDVTFNTIGFTGTMTANSTFTLYRDNEGTGARSYNVYCKNLSGNYTLTLTTGVSGATNFTIKGGQNIVARILVDEDGNILPQSMTATDLIESGNNQPATSSGVAGAIENVLNKPLIKTFSNNVASNKIIHLGHFTIPSYYINSCGLNIEIEVKRADGSYKILGSILTQTLKIGVFDASDFINLKFYKTDNNNFDLYLFIGSYIEHVFVKMTEPLHFTYDGSVVSSYTGTEVNPIYSNSVDSVILNNMQPVTSNAVYNNFVNKYRQRKSINNNVGATLTLSALGFFTCCLITLARDANDQTGIGILYWDHATSQLSIRWLKKVTNYTVTLTKISNTQSKLSVNTSNSIRLSILDLNGEGLLTLS